MLAAHANIYSQNVSKSFNSSVQLKLTSLARTTSNIENRLKECEITIHDELLTNLLNNYTYKQIQEHLLVADKGASLSPKTALCKMNDQFNCQVSPLSLFLPEVELKEEQMLPELKKGERTCYQIKKDKN